MTARIRLVETDAERDACFQVRMRVFVEEQGVPAWEELDAWDESADHFLAQVGGEIVGTARLVDLGGGKGKIGRVAVLPEHRGAGIGRELMRAVMEAGFRRHSVLVLDAQLPVIAFYERLGFQAEGEVFLDAGIPHRRMTCSRLPKPAAP